MTKTASLGLAWAPTVAVTLGSMAIVAVVALVPEVCPAIDPAPPSCAPDARESTALSWTLPLALSAATGLAAIYIVPSRLRRNTMSIALTAVSIVGVLAIGGTFLASGFVFG